MEHLFKGYLTTPAGLEAVGHVRTRDDLQYGNPDVQFHMLVNLPPKEGIQWMFDSEVIP